MTDDGFHHPSQSGQMTEAFIGQLKEFQKSQYVNRTNWSQEHWVEDAKELMNHPDGAITSLVNGHVMAMLKEIDDLKQEIIALNEHIAIQELRD